MALRPWDELKKIFAMFGGNLNVEPSTLGPLKIEHGGTGNTTGRAASATVLATARTIRTNLASASAALFNGSANVTPGVTGVLQPANGGTGVATVDELKTLLGITSGGGIYNTLEEITVSGNYIPKITGWVKVTCVGGGGNGGANANGIGGGGGGAGFVKTDYFFLNAGDSLPVVIGGANSATKFGSLLTANAGTSANAAGVQGGGGIGGTGGGIGGTGAANAGSLATGGPGGTNGTPYGGGGGGAGGSGSSGHRSSGGPGGSNGSMGPGGSAEVGQAGGAGGPGAVILEYFDPDKETA
jgi:hypothetical protein